MSAWNRPDPSPLRPDFYESRRISIVDRRAVIATFRGEAAATHELIHFFSAMEKAIMELLESEQPTALILDLRELKYTWGDEMAQMLSVVSSWSGGDFPIAIIISDLNREGLTSLVREELFLDPAEWLSNSVDEAVALLRSKLHT